MLLICILPMSVVYGYYLLRSLSGLSRLTAFLDCFDGIDGVRSMFLSISGCSCLGRLGKRTAMSLSDRLPQNSVFDDVWSLLYLTRFSNSERGT